MKKYLLFVIITTLLIISCGENKTPKTNVVKDGKAEELLSDKPFIISSIWMRAGAQNRNSAAFMKITNNMDADDTLFAVLSDFAKVTELHETYEKENDLMGMRHVDYLVIPSKSVVELKPGSFHIMLIGLNKDLGIGDTGKLTLAFKNAGKVDLPVSVGTVGK